MAAFPDINDLPPESLARLRANNPGLLEAVRPAEPRQEAKPSTVGEMVSLEARMRSSIWDGTARLYDLQHPKPLPVYVPEKSAGVPVFWTAFVLLWFIYLAVRVGALG